MYEKLIGKKPGNCISIWNKGLDTTEVKHALNVDYRVY